MERFYRGVNIVKTVSRYEQHKHTVHYVFTVKFTKVNWGQTSFYKESNLNWTMEYIFFLGVLICRFITIFFLIVTLAHQHVGGTCWTCFTPWSLFFRNMAQFSWLWEVCSEERDRIAVIIVVAGRCRRIWIDNFNGGRCGRLANIAWSYIRRGG